MWKHCCLVERSSMEIGEGEACNWCGAREDTKLSIEEGQQFVDEPVIEHILGGVKPISRFAGFRRVPLRWMKPDGKGGLEPK